MTSPVLLVDDLSGALREVDRREFIVATVEDLVVQLPGCLFIVASRLLGLDDVELGNLVVRRRGVGHLSRPEREVVVA